MTVRVFVAGGSGVLGRRLVPQLVTRPGADLLDRDGKVRSALALDKFGRVCIGRDNVRW